MVLYWRETLSLTFMEEHGLKACENRVPRKLFGTKKAEMTGGWRKLHNEVLRNLCSSLSIIGMIQ
jgi:hypothetical protein